MAIRHVVILLPALWWTAADAAEPPLTDGDVQRVIAAARDLQPVLEKHQQELEAWGKREETTLGEDPCKDTARMRSAPGYEEMTGVVKRHGFADGSAYCRTSVRVFAACGAIDAARTNPNWRADLTNRGAHMAEAGQRMQKALQAVDANPQLSAEQKQAMRQQMAQMVERMDKANRNPMLAIFENVTEADMRTVEPHCEALKAAMPRFAQDG
jgi:hypothetical protein